MRFFGLKCSCVLLVKQKSHAFSKNGLKRGQLDLFPADVSSKSYVLNDWWGVRVSGGTCMIRA